ncbi:MULTISPECIES: M24 family metallopeptidase [Odoribacter]|jgi:Xaa-Pro aminopeptidase|uniref:Aminopeptidase P family protein n=1 Tax=Odoribacter splanchnicus TaxID=28118 RepID=A0A412TV74_9BACT|nr:MULTISPECIES: Xaa-Pro peptidase family protein [Odoribacter]MBP7379729.1 aminopeptidase P family protein [Odoribacter sp.]MBP8907229.1 aminopeptidase P family protein [Odoribacter sp.]MCQ4902309.1 Xaa-Pro peptidase family protein [Odoribacter splanchnicus]MDB9209459.1 Xaa-Pro peptidase family protein [Odoribacter splanchnicus]MDB9225172.1 Xaa-Pro peptidase family protein [Odoribacter splanchnicus]
MERKQMENELELKWRRIQQAMRQEEADGCLLTMNMNLYYVSGQVFNGYFYLPAEGRPYWFVKRLTIPETNQVHVIRKPEQIPDFFRDLNLAMPRKLLLEADELSYNEYIRLQHVFRAEATGNASALIRHIRMIKTPWEIEQMRISARKHEAVYREIPACYRPGMRDIELQIEIEKRMRVHGSLGYFRAFGSNMDIFMGSLLAGENAGEPSPFDFALGGTGMHASGPLGANGTLLREGTTVMADMSGNYTAYQTDMTRVFSIGKLPDRAYRVHRVALEIQARMERTAKPGVPCAELYRDALAMAGQEGLEDCFMGTRFQAKFVGHGVGLEINELPVLTTRSKDILQPGMTFAFEPKFVLAGIGAVGIENTFLVTDSGVEKMTLLDENIIEL